MVFFWNSRCPKYYVQYFTEETFGYLCALVLPSKGWDGHYYMPADGTCKVVAFNTISDYPVDAYFEITIDGKTIDFLGMRGLSSNPYSDSNLYDDDSSGWSYGGGTLVPAPLTLKAEGSTYDVALTEGDFFASHEGQFAGCVIRATHAEDGDLIREICGEQGWHYNTNPSNGDKCSVNIFLFNSNTSTAIPYPLSTYSQLDSVNIEKGVVYTPDSGEFTGLDTEEFQGWKTTFGKENNQGYRVIGEADEDYSGVVPNSDTLDLYAYWKNPGKTSYSQFHPYVSFYRPSTGVNTSLISVSNDDVSRTYFTDDVFYKLSTLARFPNYYANPEFTVDVYDYGILNCIGYASQIGTVYPYGAISGVNTTNSYIPIMCYNPDKINMSQIVNATCRIFINPVTKTYKILYNEDPNVDPLADYPEALFAGVVNRYWGYMDAATMSVSYLTTYKKKNGIFLWRQGDYAFKTKRPPLIPVLKALKMI